MRLKRLNLTFNKTIPSIMEESFPYQHLTNTNPQLIIIYFVDGTKGIPQPATVHLDVGEHDENH